MVHVDTKRLPLLKGQKTTDKRDYLFVAIDDFSRELQTNCKAERVIRTIMEMWHEKQSFDSPEYRQKELCRFMNFYNTVKPHDSLGGDTTFEVLQASFPICGVNNAVDFYSFDVAKQFQ